MEVGFAGSTQSAGKLHTWGSGEADEDGLYRNMTCTHEGRKLMSTTTKPDSKKRDRPQGAVYLVGTPADARISQGNLEEDKPESGRRN